MKIPPIRVSYLLSILTGGTAEHLLSVLASRESGDWQAIVLSEINSSTRDEWADPVRILPSVPRLSRFPLSQWIRFRQVRRLLVEIRPQILHTYFFWSIIYGRLLKAFGIVTRLVENREDLGFSWGRFEYAVLRLTARYPDRVICVCDAVREVVLAREGLDPAIVVIIRNGVPISTREDKPGEKLRRELKIPYGHMVVGMVANFDRAVKGADHYVDCIPHVVRRLPNVSFILVGRGPDADHLMARAQKLGVSDQFILVGFRTDIEPVYDLMDVSVLSSLSEGLSITILESMARAVPVVATRVGGNPELVSDGVTGLLVPPGIPTAMADGIVRLLLDDELRNAFGRAGKAVVKSDFHVDSVAKKYAMLYRDVMNL